MYTLHPGLPDTLGFAKGDFEPQERESTHRVRQRAPVTPGEEQPNEIDRHTGVTGPILTCDRDQPDIRTNHQGRPRPTESILLIRSCGWLNKLGLSRACQARVSRDNGQD